MNVKSKLSSWPEGNGPGTSMVYFEEFWQQMNFLNENLNFIFKDKITTEQYLNENTIVISEYTSKNIKLPIVQLTLPDGFVITMRGNFKNWKISISSPTEVSRLLCDTLQLFDPAEEINPLDCDGFPKRLIYKPYNENQKQFTIQINYDFHILFMFLRSLILVTRKQA